MRGNLNLFSKATGLGFFLVDVQSSAVRIEVVAKPWLEMLAPKADRQLGTPVGGVQPRLTQEREQVVAVSPQVLGQPPVGRTVGIRFRIHLTEHHRPAAVSVTRTGSDGEYLLRGLRNGDYILLVDTNGRRVYQGRIALPAAGLVKNIDLQRK